MSAGFLADLISRGIAEGSFPSAAAVVGRGADIYDMACAGYIYLPDGSAPDAHTLYDMASLTKLMAPTMLALRAIEDGALALDDELSAFFDVSDDKARITIRMLMTHTGGFPASFRLTRGYREILSRPLATAPGGAPVYSCMGFILLGKIFEKLYATPLDILARERVFAPLHMTETGYLPKTGVFAHTEAGCVPGVVHDENARLLGGVSGNAGVFSNIRDMSRFARMLSLRGDGFIAPETLAMAIANYTPGYDVHRGLGFHLGGTPDNYIGTRFPPESFGHTGFTGTSLVVDPFSGLYAVLLTNRVHPSRENQKLFPFRRAFHDAVYEHYN